MTNERFMSYKRIILGWLGFTSFGLGCAFSVANGYALAVLVCLVIHCEIIYAVGKANVNKKW